MRRHPSSAFTLTEVLVALLVLSTVVAVSLSVFVLANRKAALTRKRAGAVVVAQSFFEEVAEHEYGAPPFAWWPQGKESVERRFEASLQGRKAPLVYQLRVSYENGSFVGKSRKKQDVVHLEVSWSDGEAESLKLSQKVWKP